MIRAVLIDVGETLVERISDGQVPLRHQSMRPFPDTAAALSAVKRRGYKLAAVSNTEQSGDRELDDALTRAGIRDSFDVVLTSTSVGERKPAPGLYRRALQLLGCEASEAVMVGDDALVDLVGGAALGMLTVLVVRPGSKGPVDDVPATFTVTSLTQLPEILDRLNEGDGEAAVELAKRAGTTEDIRKEKTR
jgi:2-haloalkanoic acid dehalogenase type II